MAFTHVQSVEDTGSAGANSTTASITISPTADNLLILDLGIHFSSGTITDYDGFTVIDERDNSKVSHVFAYKIASGSETSVDLAWTTSRSYSACIIEYSATGAISLDVSAAADSGATEVFSQTTGTTATTAQADSLAVGMWASSTARRINTSVVVSGDSSSFRYDNIATDGTACPYAVADNLSKSVGTAEFTLAHSDSGDEMAGSVAVFKEASSGTSVTATTGSMSIASTDTSTNVQTNVSATTASMSVATTNASVNASTQVDVSSASVSTASTDSLVNAATNVVTTTSSMTTATTDASVTVGGGVSVVATTASITTVTTDAVVSVNERVNVLATTGSVSVASTNAIVTTDVSVNATAASIALLASDTSVNASTSVVATTNTMSISTTDTVINAATNVLATTASAIIAATNAVITSAITISATSASMIMSPTNVTVTVGIFTGVPIDGLDEHLLDVNYESAMIYHNGKRKMYTI